jgi:glycerol-3-phosphate dehydrogenase (NAD(P)+)
MKISVFGAGAWGMALALLLYENGHAVTLRSSSPERAAELASRRVNPRLGGVELPPGIRVTSSVPEASGGAELAVVAREEEVDRAERDDGVRQPRALLGSYAC